MKTVNTISEKAECVLINSDLERFLNFLVDYGVDKNTSIADLQNLQKEIKSNSLTYEGYRYKNGKNLKTGTYNAKVAGIEADETDPLKRLVLTIVLPKEVVFFKMRLYDLDNEDIASLVNGFRDGYCSVIVLTNHSGAFISSVTFSLNFSNKRIIRFFDFVFKEFMTKYFFANKVDTWNYQDEIVLRVYYKEGFNKVPTHFMGFRVESIYE